MDKTVRNRSLTEFRETVNRRVINPGTRDRWITWVYMAFALAMLLHHVYITVFYPFPEPGAIPFRFPWVFLAGITILLGRMWKDRCFWILGTLLLIKFLRVAIPMPENLSEIQTVYELCIYAFFICYGAGRVFTPKDRETFISLFCALWTAAMTVYACIGLYTVFTGTEIFNLGTKSFYVHTSENRLWPIYHPVEAGTLAALSIAVALVGFFIARRKKLRGLYIPAVLLIFLLNIFCSSRTSYILTGMGFGAPAAMLMYELLQRWKRQGKGFTLLRIGVACVTFAGCAALLVLLQMKAVPAYNSLRNRGVGLVSGAKAEMAAETEGIAAADETENIRGITDPAGDDAAPDEVDNVAAVLPDEGGKADLNTRDFVTDEGVDGLLTGRMTIWIHCCSGIAHYPIYALIGAGVYEPMEHINHFIRAGLALPEIYHFHSTFIQTLWESGIPGFLLFVFFFGIFVWNAVGLIRNRCAPMWRRLIFLPAALCWLADLIDCTGYCNWGKPPMTILYLFTGLTIVTARELRKSKEKEQTECITGKERLF